MRHTKHTILQRPQIFQQFPGLIAAESTRHGGISPSPYASLNMGINTSDAEANISENRRRFFQALGLSKEQLASSYQVHDNKV